MGRRLIRGATLETEVASSTAARPPLNRSTTTPSWNQ